MLREPYQNEISLTCAIVYYWLRGSVIWLLNSVQLKSNSVPEWETIQNSFTKKMTRNDREWSRHQFWRLKRRKKNLLQFWIFVNHVLKFIYSWLMIWRIDFRISVAFIYWTHFLEILRVYLQFAALWSPHRRGLFRSI